MQCYNNPHDDCRDKPKQVATAALKVGGVNAKLLFRSIASIQTISQYRFFARVDVGVYTYIYWALVTRLSNTQSIRSTATAIALTVDHLRRCSDATYHFLT